MKFIFVLLFSFSAVTSSAAALNCQVNLSRYSETGTTRTIVNLAPYSEGGLPGLKGQADGYEFLILDVSPSLSYSIKLPGHSTWNIVGLAPIPNVASSFSMQFYVPKGDNELVCSKP